MIRCICWERRREERERERQNRCSIEAPTLLSVPRVSVDTQMSEKFLRRNCSFTRKILHSLEHIRIIICIGLYCLYYAIVKFDIITSVREEKMAKECLKMIRKISCIVIDVINQRFLKSYIYVLIFVLLR